MPDHSSPARRAAVLGRPISHSLSPALHAAAYRALGLDWVYEAIDCGVEELARVLADRPDWAGFSCTMPLKHAALEIAADASDAARAVGAANTLTPGATGWIADNTDVDGLVAALATTGVRPATATVLGAGGTAQAAVAALHRMGLRQVDVLVRDRSRAGAVVATADRLGVRLTFGPLDPAAPALGTDLVISTLPSGAADGLGADHRWRAGQAVLDVVYSPWPTRLAHSAGAGGAVVVSGALMLLHQAAEQVRLMTGQHPPVEAMRAALVERGVL